MLFVGIFRMILWMTGTLSTAGIKPCPPSLKFLASVHFPGVPPLSFLIRHWQRCRSISRSNHEPNQEQGALPFWLLKNRFYRRIKTLSNRFEYSRFFVDHARRYSSKVWGNRFLLVLDKKISSIRPMSKACSRYCSFFANIFLPIQKERSKYMDHFSWFFTPGTTCASSIWNGAVENNESIFSLCGVM